MRREAKVIFCTCDHCGEAGQFETSDPHGWSRVSLYLSRKDDTGLAASHLDLCPGCHVKLCEWLKVDPKLRTRDEIDE